MGDGGMGGMDPGADGGQPVPIQYQGQENTQKAYFDSIETDEFVMPNKFEVEIRMQDNQVSYIHRLNKPAKSRSAIEQLAAYLILLIVLLTYITFTIDKTCYS